LDLASILQALGVLVSVSVFTTGFLSVRLHAERTRALDRSDQAEQHLSRQVTNNEWISDRDLTASYDSLSSIDVSIPRAIAYGNVLVFGIVAFLICDWANEADWRWVGLGRAPASFWTLAAIALVELIIVAIGIFDVEQVVLDSNCFRWKRNLIG
jgi:hypothetical protein